MKNLLQTARLYVTGASVLPEASDKQLITIVKFILFSSSQD